MEENVDLFSETDQKILLGEEHPSIHSSRLEFLVSRTWVGLLGMVWKAENGKGLKTEFLNNFFSTDQTLLPELKWNSRDRNLKLTELRFKPHPTSSLYFCSFILRSGRWWMSGFTWELCPESEFRWMWMNGKRDDGPVIWWDNETPITGDSGPQWVTRDVVISSSVSDIDGVISFFFFIPTHPPTHHLNALVHGKKSEGGRTKYGLKQCKP